MRVWRFGFVGAGLALALACGGGGEEAARPVTGAAVEPAAPTAGAAAAPEAGAPEAPAGADAEDVDVGAIPAELRDGSAASRLAAVARFEPDPDLTEALAWVMRTDPDEAVRERAWRALRARWKKGVGEAGAHESAAVWVAANGALAVRVEALEALGAHSRDLARPGAHLADPEVKVRTAAAEAVFAIASRTGKRAEAKKLLQDRLAFEASGPLRAKLEGWAGKL